MFFPPIIVCVEADKLPYHKPVIFTEGSDFIQGSLLQLYLTKMRNHVICPNVRLKCQHLGY